MKKLTFILGICTFVFTIYSAYAQPASGYRNDGGQSQGYHSSQSQNRINWQPTYNSAVAASRTLSKPILILFTGTHWCPACMKLERDVLTKPEFARAVGDRLVFLKAEFPNYTADSIEASPFKFLLDRYKVDAFPTMIIINPEGHVLFNVNYQTGGVEPYIQEITKQLSQFENSNPNSNFY